MRAGMDLVTRRGHGCNTTGSHQYEPGERDIHAIARAAASVCYYSLLPYPVGAPSCSAGVLP